ncbi:MAG: TIGR00730 family Rossman fold protein [Alphaproteobacteria bacterium]|nr:TIGR00730 family Rossman fold protein [Alphaproteobacteria bacterium]
MSQNRSICVYCGSQSGQNPDYEKAARVLGRSLAEHDIRLVYGGGTHGIMGAVAIETIQHGGLVTGIIPEFLQEREAGESAALEFDELLVTKDMHERKHKMFDRSGAFVALPGGIGTLEEIIEIMTWAQLGRHRYPMVLANIGGFWDPLLQLLSHMADEGFLHSQHLVRPLVIDEPNQIVAAIIKAWETTDGDSGDAQIIEKM